MKAFLILSIICIGSALSFSVPKISEELLRKQLIAEIKFKLVNPKGLIPPQDDPLLLDDQEFVFDSETLKGSASIAGGVIEGLSTLTENIQINVLTLRVTATIDLATLKLTGDYVADAVATAETGDVAITGNGALAASGSGLLVKVALTLFPNLITNRVTVRNLIIDLGFSTLEINAENAALDGELIDWAAVNESIKEAFDTAWPIAKPELELFATEALNEVLAEYTLQEIIELIIGGGGKVVK